MLLWVGNGGGVGRSVGGTMVLVGTAEGGREVDVEESAVGSACAVGTMVACVIDVGAGLAVMTMATGVGAGARFKIVGRTPMRAAAMVAHAPTMAM